MNIVPVEKNGALCIGEEIHIIVRRIYPSGDVELGIEAPKDIAIHREEYLVSLKKLKEQLNTIKE